MRTIPIDAMDYTGLGLIVGAHLLKSTPEERRETLTAIAKVLNEPWQKVEALNFRGRGQRREKCQCQITQYREPHRAPTLFACNRYATWKINGLSLCGTHANAFVWERVLQENGYNAHSDGILIQDGIRPSQGRKEPPG